MTDSRAALEARLRELIARWRRSAKYAPAEIAPWAQAVLDLTDAVESLLAEQPAEKEKP